MEGRRPENHLLQVLKKTRPEKTLRLCAKNTL